MIKPDFPLNFYQISQTHLSRSGVIKDEFEVKVNNIDVNIIIYPGEYFAVEALMKHIRQSHSSRLLILR